MSIDLFDPIHLPFTLALSAFMVYGWARIGARAYFREKYEYMQRITKELVNEKG